MTRRRLPNGRGWLRVVTSDERSGEARGQQSARTVRYEIRDPETGELLGYEYHTSQQQTVSGD